MTMHRLGWICVEVAGAGCAAGSNTDPGSAGHDSGGGLQVDGGDGGLSGDGGPIGPGDGTPVIYANTDDSLYSMDPTTKKVTLIGKFTGGTGSMTDCAVNGEGKLFVNSTTEVYSAALPAGGAGPVTLTLKTTLPTASKFYALGFTPAGVLEPDESLIAGDGAGDLYFIDTTGPAATPLKLGVFGSWTSGDPGPGKVGDLWTLSGDVVFYMDGATPRGLATLRACTPSATGKPKCQSTNDVLAEIDMTALKKAFDTKSPANVRKRIIGGGAGVGELYGVGAWDDTVYAFGRNPAQLVGINGSGAGASLETFSSITNGWSGAGVTTKAKISVIR